MATSPLADAARPLSADPWGSALRRAGAFQIAAAGLVLFFALLRGDDALPYHYFMTQDLPMLVAGGGVLMLLPMAGGMRTVPTLAGRQVTGLALAAALIAYAGSFVILHHYALSRDEQMAELGAAALAQGRLGLEYPAALAPLARAMVPQFAGVHPDALVWVSEYLPVNSAFRAIAWRLGDSWLAGPMLLCAGLFGVWTAARRIWPDQPHAATVALLLAVGSTQLLVTAMSPFAMTGHFALNALWLACFLRRDTAGRLGAVVLTLLAVGLHQAHFHLMFLTGFLVVLAARRRWAELALYTGAAIAAYLLWQVGYRGLIPTLFDLHPVAPTGNPVANDVQSRIMRVLAQDTLRNLSRFVAWQHILLAPLTVIGVASLRRDKPDALAACAISCLIGMMVMPAQEHGFGYRYMHGLIAPFCLLGAQGWLAMETMRGRGLPRAALYAATAFGLLVALPYLGWRSAAYAAPYETAYRAIRNADVDYVLVDTTPQTYASDLVRFDLDAGPRQRPIVLDVAQVSPQTIARLCSTGSVALFGWPQMTTAGIQPYQWDNGRRAATAARMAQLRAIGCGRPVAVAR